MRSHRVFYGQAVGAYSIPPFSDQASWVSRTAIMVSRIVFHVLCLFQSRVREHAAIPADMFDTTGFIIFEPVARALHDVELPVRVIRRAVLASLVMGTSSMDFSVILSHMEIDRSRAVICRSSVRTPPRIPPPNTPLSRGHALGHCNREGRRYVWARSAWKPTVSGIPTSSSRSSMSFQLCIPAQQISPSAANRSP